MSTLNKLGNILDKTRRSVVTIDTVNANGTTTVIHYDGTKSVVLGDSFATGKVYIKDGVIIGNAADLPYSEISI